jgi:hypothetical protein
VASIFFDKPLLASEGASRTICATPERSIEGSSGSFGSRLQLIRERLIEDPATKCFIPDEGTIASPADKVLLAMMEDTVSQREKSRGGTGCKAPHGLHQRAAANREGTSTVLDTARTWDVPVGNRFRNFGHRTVNGRLWDRSGNWADTGTAVTARQLAAMPEMQQRAFAEWVGLVDLDVLLAPEGAGEIQALSDPEGLCSSLSEESSNPYAALAQASPDRWITMDSHRMRAATAARFWELRRRLGEEFPNRKVIITSTTTGRHSSAAHPEGRAVDFVVAGLRRSDSHRVAEIAQSLGFAAVNEYVRNTRHKTGDHMHVSLPLGDVCSR